MLSPRIRRAVVTLASGAVALSLSSLTSGTAAGSEPDVRPLLARTTGTPIKVGSFNIVSVVKDGDTTGAALPWYKRRDTVAEQIAAAKLDVVGLQEASQYKHHYLSPTAVTQYGDLIAGLAAAGATYAVTDVDPLTSGDTRILYNPARLTVLDHGSYDYTGDGKTNAGEAVVWAVFRTIPSGKKFFFATTHLMPHDTSLQMKEWKQLIPEVKDLRQGLPVIVTGDFQQSKWHDPTATMLPKMKNAGFGDVTGSTVKDNHLRHPRAQSYTRQWLDSKNQWDRVVKNNSMSPHQGMIGQNIDWIFATNSLTVKNWTVAAHLNSAQTKYAGTMPSDHDLVHATIVLP